MRPRSGIARSRFSKAERAEREKAEKEEKDAAANDPSHERHQLIAEITAATKDSEFHAHLPDMSTFGLRAVAEVWREKAGKK